MNTILRIIDSYSHIYDIAEAMADAYYLQFSEKSLASLHGLARGLWPANLNTPMVTSSI